MHKQPLKKFTAEFISACLIIMLILAALPVIPAKAATATVVTTSASAVWRTNATLNGTVNANGDNTLVTFQYGPTISYGSTINAVPNLVTGNIDTAVSATIIGLLTPGTLYHYRVVGVNGAGTAYGSDLTFTTDPAGSTTYYVNKTNGGCSDLGSGTLAVPFCTIATGANTADAGDTVRVLAGSYAETVQPKFNGGAGIPITFSAAPGVSVTGRSDAPLNATSGGAFRLFNKSYIIIDGFTVNGTVDYGIITTSCNHITISNNHVSNSGLANTLGLRPGIYLTSTVNSIVIGNTTDHNTFDGIRLNNGSNFNWIEKNTSFGNATDISSDAVGIGLFKNSNYNTIIRNTVYANEDSGMNFYSGSSHNSVVNNLSYGNGDHGMDNNGSPNNSFVGNTVQGNVTTGINLEQDSLGAGSDGATLRNNILVDNGYRRYVGGGTFITSNGGNIRVDNLSIPGTTIDFDLIYSSPGYTDVQITWGTDIFFDLNSFKTAFPAQEANGLQANPLLAAPAAIAERPSGPPYHVAIHTGDYHITAGSPAIDSANSNAPNEQTVDIEGNPRVDISTIPNTGTGVRHYDDRGAYEYQPGVAHLHIYLPFIRR